MMTQKNHVHVFVYGNERRGLLSQHLLESFEIQRSEAEATGRLYAQTVSFPAAVFDAQIEGSRVVGELVQVSKECLFVVLQKLALAHGCAKENDPHNLFKLRQIAVRLLDSGNEVTGVYAFEAANSEQFKDAQMVVGGDWIAYRKGLSARTDSDADPRHVSGLRAAPANVG